MATVIRKKAKKKGKQIKFTDFRPTTDPATQEVQTICPRQSQPPIQDSSSSYFKDSKLPGANMAIKPPYPPSQKAILPGAHLPQTQKKFTLPGSNLPPAFSANPFSNMQYQNQNFMPFPQQQQPFFPNQIHSSSYSSPQISSQPQPSCVVMANQAHQLAKSMLPPQMQQNFSKMFNDFVFQVGTNRNYDASGAAKKMMQQLNPEGYDDFEDYTQDTPGSLGVDKNKRQMTQLDHKFMDMMEKKIEKQIDNQIKSTQEHKYKEVCKFYMNGNCKFGPSCKYNHPSEDESIVNKINFQDDKECCICYSLVRASNKQFGLLTGCDHAFCLQCIRKWRGQVNYEHSGKDQSRLCPICRKQSFVVLPSNGYIRGKEKQKMMVIYKARLKQLPCKHFNFGKSKCPFLNSCFYSHTLKDGTSYEYPFQTPQFSMQNQEWVEDDQNLQTLSAKLNIEG